ncbi:MAG: ATP-binding protein [Oscillospiraceae bacterium]
MQSAYALATRELNEIRTRNQNEVDKRTAFVRNQSEDFANIERSLIHAGTMLIKSVLDNSINFDSVKRSIQNLQHQKLEILKSLSLPSDYLDDIYSCTNCRDTGFDDNGLRCDCLKKMAVKYIIKNSNLTEHMRNQTFDNFDFTLFASQSDQNGRNPLKIIKAAHDNALCFAETFEDTHKNLLFLGNAGTGKTYLSSCIANLALARGKTVYYQTAYKLFELLEQVKFGKIPQEDLEQAEYAAKYLKIVDLLIIDDLGTEFITQFSAAALFDIINSRLIEGKSTILSSNLSLESLETTYSNRLKSRLMGEYDVIKLLGDDIRMQKRFMQTTVKKCIKPNI